MQVINIETDSREVLPGSDFYALKGARVDAHNFLQEVAKKGAKRAFVDKGYDGEGYGMELIYETDVLVSLQNRAKKALEERKCHVVGITGSIGKTTVKEFAAVLLAERFSVAKSKRSCNGQIGLPISILEADPEAEILVLEMGMSKQGEMDRLVEIAPIHTALITRVSMSHAAYFSGIDEIAEQKSVIFSSPKCTRRFASAQAAQFAAISQWEPEIIDTFVAPFAEDHLQECFNAAAMLAKSFGLTDEEIARGAKKLRPVRHRFERIEIDGVIYIDDSYNANVESMHAAMRNLPEGRRIGVLGEMGELGDFTREAHLSVGRYAQDHLDLLLGFGENSKIYCEAFGTGEWFTDFQQLQNALKQLVQKGDVVLLKGANTKRLWRLIEK